jgi:2-polyprenyl-3-methyl-5-hydroxy-6-metoxy-1,4-benzoquinol methylase
MPSPLRSRGKVTYDWIPKGTKTLLDAGCAHGTFSKFYAEKVKEMHAIDPIPMFIEKARKINAKKNLTYHLCAIEKTPFKDGQFDVVTLNDVIEHVQDEKKAIKEMDRVLKNGGTMIITVPHSGLFGFLDCDNYVFFTKKYVPIIYKLAYFVKRRQWPKTVEFRKGYDVIHKHYTLKSLSKFLPKNYTITKVHRGGFLFNPVVANLKLALSTIFGDEKFNKYFDTPTHYLSEWEYFVPFGPLAYHMAISAKKK